MLHWPVSVLTPPISQCCLETKTRLTKSSGTLRYPTCMRKRGCVLQRLKGRCKCAMIVCRRQLSYVCLLIDYAKYAETTGKLTATNLYTILFSVTYYMKWSSLWMVAAIITTSHLPGRLLSLLPW